MSIQFGPNNPLNPLISAATSIEEGIVHEITSIPSYLGCSATPDSIASNANEDDLPYCCTLGPKIFLFALSFAGWFYFVSDCVSDFFSDLFSCFSGEVVEGHIDQRAKEATRHLWVNRSRIHEAPALIDDYFQTLSPAEERIALTELNTLCNQIFKNSRTTSSSTSPYSSSTSSYIKTYVHHVASSASYNGSNMRNENLQKIARMLIIELRKKDIPLEKKQHALTEIGDAATHCSPRIYEESQRQWKLLTNRITTLDEKFKLWLQMLKEDIIISRYQGSQFHVLNHARARLSDWGLDQSPVNLEDPYMDMFSIFTSGLNYRYTLNREYTPERIVSLIRDKIINEGDNTQINTYFQAHQQELSDAGLSYQDLFESDGKSISHKGAAWLLKMHNFFY